MKLFKIDSQLKLNCSGYEENKKNDQLVFLIYDWSIHILLIQNNNNKKTKKEQILLFVVLIVLCRIRSSA